MLSSGVILLRIPPLDRFIELLSYPQVRLRSPDRKGVSFSIEHILVQGNLIWVVREEQVEVPGRWHSYQGTLGKSISQLLT